MLIGCRNPHGENKTRTIPFKVVHYILNRSVKDSPPPPFSVFQEILGSLSKDDGDVNENGKNDKTTTLHVHQAFLYISSRSLHDYDEKLNA